ncbi:hypothetical protein SAMN05421743_101350 [Thalassobacillus cyri]|uniref:Uncharacterized protein n=1 Tax=Thalassobacillus cyri TaxID=571932 RepID=A0A1H3W9T1_9BACI|nr:hypothetical protein [Thalassobacillus cyri]SDZ83092.1 hypothetical protein SAMN05421743_101350 [Thalassobacillus cyri]
MYPYYFYRVNNWGQVLTLLQQSLYAEQMVCSYTSELYHIPETQNLTGLNDMHRQLIPASYHRVTATGSAQRLVNGEQQQTIINTLSACINNAAQRDEAVDKGLQVMEENINAEYKGAVQTAMQWQEYAKAYLSQAKEAVQNMGMAVPDGSGQENGGASYE